MEKKILYLYFSMRILITYFLLIFSFLVSCVSDKQEGPVVSDKTMFDLLKSSSSFSFYKNRIDTLVSDPSSPHGSYMRVLFNPKAVAAMNDSLSALAANVYPDEALIVKEVYFQSGGPLESYVVMYKLHNAANSQNGWVWNEMKPDGTVIHSTAEKGDQCYQCHQDLKNSDLVTTFFLH